MIPIIKTYTRRPKPFAVLPTLLTLGNGVCGLGALTFAAHWTGYDQATSLFASGSLVYLAMLFDALDGAAARWANQTSEFGERLDSLCDAISFGAAPSFLMLELSLSHGYHPRVLWVVAALYMVCAVLRLARFGVESGEGHEPGMFYGLPSPAAAAVVASFSVMLFGPQFLSDGEPGPTEAGIEAWAPRMLPVVTFGVACLMVSRVRYRHAFYRLIRGWRSGSHLVKIVFAVAIIAAVPRVVVPLLTFWYAFVPPAVALWNRRLRLRLAPGRAARPPALDGSLSSGPGRQSWAADGRAEPL